MCKCISSNQPEAGGTDQPAVMTPPWLDARPVSIDYCITDDIRALWDAGIGTLSSCCGHNDVRPSVVLSHWSDGPDAVRVLSARGREWDVLAWVLQSVSAPEGDETPAAFHCC